MKSQRHIVHLVYRFAAGGLENVIVQLINGLPHDEFRHTVVALTEVDPAFSARIERKDVELIALHKKPGQPFALYPKMYALLRRLKPDVLHTCNIAALEFMPIAALAGVSRRIHAEHGWDVADQDGSNRHYRNLRRLYRSFVHEFITVSVQLHDYLRDAIGISKDKLQLIPNGVDTERFSPRPGSLPADFPFDIGQHFIIGSVGRLEPIKNYGLLVDAFIALAKRESNSHFRLMIAGDGPQREILSRRLAENGLGDRAWLPGGRSDIPELLSLCSCFVLPSLAEGTSCTLQEAMSTGLNIVATDVGGNADLLGNGSLGTLVASGDVLAMTQAIEAVAGRPNEVFWAAREAVTTAYSLQGMLAQYRKLMGDA